MVLPALGKPNVRIGTPFRGQGFIAGQGGGLVTKAGAPASEIVYLGFRSTGSPFNTIGIKISGADGTYRFDQLNENLQYVVLAYDSSGTFNAVIRDAITPAPIS